MTYLDRDQVHLNKLVSKQDGNSCKSNPPWPSFWKPVAITFLSRVSDFWGSLLFPEALPAPKLFPLVLAYGGVRKIGQMNAGEYDTGGLAEEELDGF